MLIQNSCSMATDDYAVMAVVVGFAIIVGFIFGKISQKADYNSRLDQKILISELERWKLRPSIFKSIDGKETRNCSSKGVRFITKKKRKNDDDLDKIGKKFEQLIEKKWMY